MASGTPPPGKHPENRLRSPSPADKIDHPFQKEGLPSWTEKAWPRLGFLAGLFPFIGRLRDSRSPKSTRGLCGTCPPGTWLPEAPRGARCQPAAPQPGDKLKTVCVRDVSPLQTVITTAAPGPPAAGRGRSYQLAEEELSSGSERRHPSPGKQPQRQGRGRRRSGTQKAEGVGGPGKGGFLCHGN